MRNPTPVRHGHPLAGARPGMARTTSPATRLCTATGQADVPDGQGEQRSEARRAQDHRVGP